MNPIKYLIFLLFPFASVFGQADTFKQTNNDTIPYATVYVYRQVDKVTALSTYHLLMTNLIVKSFKCGRLKNYTVIPVKVYQEGKTQFHTTAETVQPAFINIKLGKTYFVRCKLSSGIIVKETLDVVSKDQAEMDIDEIKAVARQYNVEVNYN